MGGMTALNTGTGTSLCGALAPADASNSGRQLGRRASLAWSWDDDQFRADTSKCVEGCWGMALLLLSIRASGGHWGGSVVHTSIRVPHQPRSAFLYLHQAPCDCGSEVGPDTLGWSPVRTELDDRAPGAA